MKTRVDGRQKWITIGKHGQPWNPDTARLEALNIKLDPSPSRIQKKRPLTMAVIIDEFERDLPP